MTELEEGGREHTFRIARDTGLCVLGFGSVFVLLGMSASSIGQILFDNQNLLTRVSASVESFTGGVVYAVGLRDRGIAGLTYHQHMGIGATQPISPEFLIAKVRVPDGWEPSLRALATDLHRRDASRRCN